MLGGELYWQYSVYRGITVIFVSMLLPVHLCTVRLTVHAHGQLCC